MKDKRHLWNKYLNHHLEYDKIIEDKAHKAPGRHHHHDHRLHLGQSMSHLLANH